MEHARSIDKSSFEPAYLQLVNILKQQVASGAFNGEGRLPSASQLCSTYGVSPMTVRRAINLLIDQGVVVTERGRGTFVRSLDLSESSFGLDTLLKLLGGSQKNSVKLLKVDLSFAADDVASKLRLKPGRRIIYIKRLITKDKFPILVHREYLIYDPRRPIVESEMEVTKLMGLLQGKGEAALKKGHFMIEAACLQGGDAELLKVGNHTPAFRLEHTFYDFSDSPVSWGWFLVRGDRLHFTADIGLWN